MSGSSNSTFEKNWGKTVETENALVRLNCIMSAQNHQQNVATAEEVNDTE